MNRAPASGATHCHCVPHLPAEAGAGEVRPSFVVQPLHCAALRNHTRAWLRVRPRPLLCVDVVGRDLAISIGEFSRSCEVVGSGEGSDVTPPTVLDFVRELHTVVCRAHGDSAMGMPSALSPLVSAPDGPDAVSSQCWLATLMRRVAEDVGPGSTDTLPRTLPVVL